MTLLEGEPAAGPWRALDTAELVNHVLQVAGQPLGRPQIVAVDGRGASGKSTLAAELKRAVARSAVVHTDDLAWHEPFFAWGHLLRDEILVTLHRGVCQTNGVTGLCCHAGLGLLRRPSNRMSKALRASFHLWVQRALPLPVGSSAMTAR